MKMKLPIALCILLLSGCATNNLWKDRSTYDETVIGFYLVEGKHEVVAVGKKYNYLFRVEPEMYEAFKLGSEIEFTLHFKDFKMKTTRNYIRGDFKLTAVKAALSESELKKLEDLGFLHGLYDKEIRLEDYISGHRHEGGGILPINEFEQGHDVTIQIPDPAIFSVGKAVLTPYTLAIDTLILIPIIVAVIANGGTR